ncbi:MAG: aminoacetone oxidase family FAD-binding enzyme [Bacillota bacterium]|nr:aminoacetone oxidase family FAD-binding enzyme [Bacillota bacterium]
MEKSIEKTNTYNCIVIGAGAAGLFYAAGGESPDKGSEIRNLILEKTTRPGQKLLMSGNGMCNITHGGSIKDFIDKYGDHGRRIRTCLYKHNNLQLMQMLEEAGVPLIERDDGKVFPASLRAGDILNVLKAKASERGFSIRCSAEVTGIQPDAGGMIAVKLAGGELLHTEKLVIATGGKSYPSTGSDGRFLEVLHRDLGIRIAQPRPALAPVYVQNYPYTDLAGISFEDVEIVCGGHKTRGPMLLTHKGFSGPAILHISQFVKTGDVMRINYLPRLNINEVYRKIKADQAGNSKSIAGYLAAEFGLPKAFAAGIFSEPGRKLSSIGHKELENVTNLIMNRAYSVSGTGGWNEAMVTAGGVELDQIDMTNMSLKACPQIHIIGEALDVNGDTGGYNLQFAYSSAMAAHA